MKILLKILLILLLVYAEASSQSVSFELLEEGNEKYNEKEYKEALKIYNNIVFNHQASEVFPLALYNKAKTLEMLNQLDYAAYVYSVFLNGAYDDKMIIDAEFMVNPYANFSHKSSMSIAKISFSQGNYQKAFDYYNLADSVYTYKGFCGNDAMEHYYGLVLLKAECLEKLGRDEDAMQLCVKHIFKGFLASTDEIIEYLIKLIDKNYSKQEFAGLLTLALEGVYKSNYGKNNDYEGYFFKLLDQEIQITDYNRFWEEIETIDEAKETAKKISFFQHYLASK